MPRLLICCGPGATRRMERLLPRLEPARRSTQRADQHLDQLPDRHADRHPDRFRLLLTENLSIYVGCSHPHPSEFEHDCDDDSGVSTAAGVILAFEGFVTHRTERGAALRTALIEDFLARGERCVETWRGSFRLLIARDGITRVYTDHTGSRPIFAAEDADGPLFCSHTAPLLAAVPQLTVDGANLLHFMGNGRFFAGASLFHEVRQLGPGRFQRIGPGTGISTGISIGNRDRTETVAWYRYQLESQPSDIAEILPELKRRIDDAVLRHWQRADAPALLLSGGYDSRYLLNTLASLVPPGALRPLLTCLWGEPNPDPDCDAAWARREADRHRLEFEFTPLRADLPALFDAMFEAQSGMTAHVVTHTDDFARCRDLSRRGYRSLIRGDECFGPAGRPVRDVSEALSRIGLNPRPGDRPRWLAPDTPADAWQAAHEERMRQLTEVADDPDDVRDLLYFHERLPSVHAHLNAQRAPFVENHNPLLDADVLDLVRRLPRELRTDKSVFRLCFRRYFPTTGFAGSGNAFDLSRLAREKALAGFLADRLDQLPHPFAPRSFGRLAARFRSAADGIEPAPSTDDIRTATRAVVLGHSMNQTRNSLG